MNFIAVHFARAVVFVVTKSWRLFEKATRHALPEKSHYFLLRIFRLFGSRYPVSFSYPNPLDNRLRVRLRLDLAQNNQLWIFRRGSGYDAELIRELAAGLDNGAEIFADIGANVGVYTMALAQKYPNRKVVAVEPFPPNLAALRTNLALNRLSNVEVFDGVVSPSEGESVFHVNPLNEGGGSLQPFSDYRTGDVVVKVETYQQRHPEFRADLNVRSIPLDRLLPSGRACIKVDVEGAEIEVLRSGERVFGSGRVESIVVEVTNETFGPAVSFLARHGMPCFRFVKGQPKKVKPDQTPDRRIINLFSRAPQRIVI